MKYKTFQSKIMNIPVEYDDNPFAIERIVPQRRVTFAKGTKPGGPKHAQDRKQKLRPIYTNDKLQECVGK